MKNKLLKLLIVFLLPLNLIAQDGYSFTLVDNGGYIFSVAAVSNYDSGTFTPLTESYGFTLVVPDGVTIAVTDIQPSGSSETITPIPGTNVSALDPTMADKDLYNIIVSTNAGTLPSHISDAILPLVTFTVNGSPVSGDLTILDNNSTLASNPALNGALDSFLQVDVTDDATVNFINGYLGQTGMTSFDFSTLGIVELEELGLELFPNPTDGILFIKGNTNKINQIEVFNLAGQRVLDFDNNFNEINLSKLDSAVYMLKIYSGNSAFTSKVIRK